MRVDLTSAPVHVAIIALLNSVLQLVIAFGGDITDAQNAALTAVGNSLLLAVSLVVTRSAGNGPAPGAGA